MSIFNPMKIYTVHVKPGLENAGQQPVFVGEGFNFFAFVFTFLWALYQRLWVPALLIFGVDFLLLSMNQHHILNHLSLAAIDLGFHILVGFWANDWLRTRLARRGYILADVTAGDNRLRAEQRYFERMLATV